MKLAKNCVTKIWKKSGTELYVVSKSCHSLTKVRGGLVFLRLKMFTHLFFVAKLTHSLFHNLLPSQIAFEQVQALMMPPLLACPQIFPKLLAQPKILLAARTSECQRESLGEHQVLRNRVHTYWKDVRWCPGTFLRCEIRADTTRFYYVDRRSRAYPFESIAWARHRSTLDYRDSACNLLGCQLFH